MLKASCLLVGLLLPLAAFAQLKEGGNLVEEFQSFEKVTAGNATEQDFIPAAKFQGYVEGVFDTLRVAERICPPANISDRQKFAVVGNFIKSDPTRWSLPAIRLVQRPILTAWQCNR